MRGIVQNHNQAHLAWEIQMGGCDCYATPKCPHPQKGGKVTDRAHSSDLLLTVLVTLSQSGHAATSASQNKSRPLGKHCDKEQKKVNIQRLRWLWVRDTETQEKCDHGHMFDL